MAVMAFTVAYPAGELPTDRINQAFGREPKRDGANHAEPSRDAHASRSPSATVVPTTSASRKASRSTIHRCARGARSGDAGESTTATRSATHTTSSIPRGGERRSTRRELSPRANENGVVWKGSN